MGATTMDRTEARTLTAFGETKTIEAWALDRRAAVYAELIGRRLEEGMSPEQAIAVPLATIERGPVKILAWGERKTLREWADDCRAAAPMGTIKARVERGWLPETAISTGARAMDRSLVEAFCERKSAGAWAIDPRCAVNECSLRARLKSGMAPEAAITTEPDQRFVRPVTAWGETKDAEAWAVDPRCGVSAQWLLIRVTRGLSPEAAMDPRTLLPKRKKIVAWGEAKSLMDWSRDPRCVVSSHTLMMRLHAGMEPERAITTAKIVERPRKVAKNARLVTAWGETKQLHTWSKDPRCAVEGTAIRHRLEQGWSPEEAIGSASTFVPRPVTAWGETRTVAEWATDARCAVAASCLYGRLKKGWEAERAVSTPSEEGWEGRSFEAFGETRTLREWSEDARCRVGYKQLQDRLRIHGMRIEVALLAPKQTYTKGKFGEMAEAFGERKLLGEWTGDVRCVVSRKALQCRLRAGWELERALTVQEHGDRPVGVQGKFLEAFGERKNIRQWSLDARCVVGEGVLKQRLDRGWDAERALTTATLEPGAVTVEREPRGAELRIAAFGETRRIGAWAKDPRCAVRTATLRLQIEKGWDPEEAIATAPGDARGDAEAVRRAKGIAVEPPEGAVLAWGERKSVADWSDDPRCAVPAGHLRHRLEMGWEPERAISTPVGEPSLRLMAAFGETKSLSAWQADARCVVSMWTVRHRLAQGWGLEKALTTMPREALEGGLTAFGETRTLAAWALDPRCQVGPAAIGSRLKEGLSPEEAIARPSHLVRDGENAPDGATVLEAFGEAKALGAWLGDPRCVVGGATLRNRIAEGMAAEEALTKPGGSPWKDGVTAWGETKSVAAWARDPRCTVNPGQVAVRLAKGMAPEEAIGGENRYAKAEPLGEDRPRGVPSFATLVTAWRETKTPQAWSRDARCAVSAETIRARLKAGLDAEAAISTSPETTERILTAWGETKTAAAWLKDPRCAVTANGLSTRLARGMTPERALSTPTAKRGATNPVTAFGESKTLSEWVEDPRCRVAYTGLQKRLLKGTMTPEEALTRPFKPVDRSRYDALATAFGETKTLKDWGRDARCVVAENTVAYRIDRGWTLTDALTTPQLRNAVGRGSRRRAA